MNEEFINRLNKSHSYDKIEACCEECKKTEEPRRVDKIRSVIKRHGKYICGDCRKQNRIITSKTRDKLRRGRLGKKHSNETRKLLSKKKKEFYKTEEGAILKKELSLKAKKQNVNFKIEKYRIKGSCLSSKTNKLLAYDSSYELRRIWLLDRDDSVVDFDTQKLFEVDDICRKTDCFIVYTDGQRKLEEIKPVSWLKNKKVQNQINDIRTIAEKLKFNFEVITEDFFGMTPKEIKNWAIEYRKEIHGIDVSEHYTQKNRDKVKRHYRNKMCDKISFKCKWCKVRHEIREIEYKDNIDRNGRYICPKENGHIVGKLPKKKKENPYAIDGKKKCNQCSQILPFDEFGKDKNKNDGLSARCKNCRKKAALKSYYAKKETPSAVKEETKIKIVKKPTDYNEITKIKHDIFDFVYLSLGAGVQSTALLAMAALGLYNCPKINCAIYADTMAEPPWVYDNLEKLKDWAKSYGVSIITVSLGSLKDELLNTNKVSVPAWTKTKDGKEMPIKRQCTAEYKIKPINQKVKEILGFESRQPVYKKVGCLLGISTDEYYRMKPSRVNWITNLYPLIDARLTRDDCLDVIKKAGLEPPKRSACFFCPFHNDEYWQNLKTEHPDLFEEAVKIEESINHKLPNGAFLNRRLTPLKTIEFSKLPNLSNNFINECEGMCGI